MSLANNSVTNAYSTGVASHPDLGTGNSASNDEKLFADDETLAPSQGYVELAPCCCDNHPILKPIQKLP